MRLWRLSIEWNARSPRVAPGDWATLLAEVDRIGKIAARVERKVYRTAETAPDGPENGEKGPAAVSALFGEG